MAMKANKKSAVKGKKVKLAAMGKGQKTISAKMTEIVITKPVDVPSSSLMH